MCACLQEVSVPSPLTAILTPNNSEPSNTFPFHTSPATVRPTSLTLVNQLISYFL